MAKKKQRESPGDLSTPSPTDPLAAASASSSEQTRTWQRVASGLIVAHFLALLLSLAANFAPSSLQGNLMEWSAIYLVASNQDYGALPLELTHGSSVDFPLWVEVRDADSTAWERVRLPGEGRRADGNPDYRSSHWPNLSRLIRLISIDQPDAELLSDVTAQVLKAHGADEQVAAVRLIEPTVMTFDQHSLVAGGQLSLIADELQPEVVFSARVVRDASGEILLLPDQEAMRTSKATDQR